MDVFEGFWAPQSEFLAAVQLHKDIVHDVVVARGRRSRSTDPNGRCFGVAKRRRQGGFDTQLFPIRDGLQELVGEVTAFARVVQPLGGRGCFLVFHLFQHVVGRHCLEERSGGIVLEQVLLCAFRVHEGG